MLWSYLTISVRTLFRHRFYAVLNTVGLAIGVGCMIVAILYFDYHLQYNADHENEGRIHRVIRHVRDADGTHYDLGTRPVGPHLKEAFPEVEEAVRVLNREMWVSHGDRGFNEWVATVDSSFTRVFTVPMVRGDARTGLLDHGSCFISETLASKLFGNEDPIGQTISIAFKWVEGDYLVAGVMDDVPQKTYKLLRYGVLTATFQQRRSWKKIVWDEWPSDWFVAPLRTYLLMREDTDMASFQRKLDAFSEKHKDADARQLVDYTVQPFSEMHLYTQRDYGLPQGEDINRCYAILGIGILVLLLACINYINLVTAQSPIRAREVGLRKVSGALRGHLIGQFLGESVLVASVAFVIALAAASVSLPFVSDLLGVELQLNETSLVVIAGLPLVFAPLTGILAGFYPAFVLSAHEPIKTVQSARMLAGSRSWLRTGLVVFQFCVSGILIVSTLIVHQQIEFVLNKDLGYHADGVVMMPMLLRTANRGEMSRKLEAIRNEIRAIPGVTHATGIFLHPGKVSQVNIRDVTPEGSTDVHRLYWQGTDSEFFDTFEIPFVAGGVPPRDKVYERLSETEGVISVIINERAAEVLGWGDNALGKRCFRELKIPDGRTIRNWYRIAGVVRDYHNQSLHYGIAPMMIQIQGGAKHVAARLGPGSLVDTLTRLEEVWDRFLPGKPFEYEFVDDIIEESYTPEVQLRKVFGFFSSLSIVIGCFGILGLVTYSAESRTKEMGIRKVLGATNGSILALLSSDFIKLVAASFVIAWPIAYVLSKDWLTHFAYRIDIGGMPFLISALLTILLVGVTVGIQSWRTSTTDPVRSLRQE